MWRVLKLERLVWAHMYEDTVHYTDNNSLDLTIAHPRSLKIEPEIVFGIKQAGEEGGDAAAALALVDWLALGFEIIDCPFPDWKFQPGDFVASFGLHAALVVGEKIPVQPELISTLVDELPRLKVRTSKQGEFVEEGSGKNSLKSPALCLAELSAAISRRFPAEPLSAGEIVSSGTLTAGADNLARTQRLGRESPRDGRTQFRQAQGGALQRILAGSFFHKLALLRRAHLQPR